MRARLALLAVLGVLALGVLGGTLRPLWQSPPGPVTFQGPLSWLRDNTDNLGTSATSGRPRDLFVARDLHVTGFVHVQGAFGTGAHMVVIASNGVGGVGNVEVLSGLRSLYLVDCLDGDGCTVQLGETNVAVGTLTRIVNVSTSGSANHNLTLADSGAMHLAGAGPGTAFDTLSVLYVCNRSNDCQWYEIGRAAN